MTRRARSGQIDFLARRGVVLYNWLRFPSPAEFNHRQENSLSVHLLLRPFVSVDPERRVQSIGA